MSLSSVVEERDVGTFTYDSTIKTLTTSGVVAEGIEYNIELQDGTIGTFVLSGNDVISVSLTVVPDDTTPINYILKHIIEILNEQDNLNTITLMAQQVAIDTQTASDLLSPVAPIVAELKTIALNIDSIVNVGNIFIEISELVSLTGNQTVSGVKTFNSSPLVPTPTTGTQAVNKDYVDDNAVVDGLLITGAGNNVDNLKDNGFYFIDSNVSGTPEATRFGLVVGGTIANGLGQTLVKTTDGKTYTRGWNGSIWSSWANLDSLYSRTSTIFGIGQTSQDVTGSRASGITYTNSTGRPIEVFFIALSGVGTQVAVNFYRDGVYLGSSSTQGTPGFQNRASKSFIVPTSSTYRIEVVFGTTERWVELR